MPGCLVPRLSCFLHRLNLVRIMKHEVGSNLKTAEVRLEVIAGPACGLSNVFQSHQTWIVGRSPHAQWSLPDDKECSRFHSRFEINPPHCVVADLRSRNGTKVNGLRISDVTSLLDGDKVQIGRSAIQVTSRHRSADSADPKSAYPKSAYPEPAPFDSTIIISRKPAIPGYDITHMVGEGGMGCVFHGLRQTDGHSVAVKLVRPASAEAERLRQFIREAAVLAKLRHPQIVRLLEFGVVDRVPFLVMEFVGTADLKEILRSSSFASRMKIASGLTCRILDALQFAHSNDIVHRDIKPSNMLVYRSGRRLRVKLADFGLAKNFMNAGLSAMSTSNEIKGTIAFMPPEQILDCRRATPACDIYAAGATLYQLVTGHQPYDFVETSEAIAKILNEPPVPPAERCPAVDPGLANVIERAMARRTEERYQSAEEMRAELLPYTDRRTYESNRSDADSGSAE